METQRPKDPSRSFKKSGKSTHVLLLTMSTAPLGRGRVNVLFSLLQLEKWHSTLVFEITCYFEGSVLDIQ